MAQQIILSLFLSTISLTAGYPTDNRGKCKLGIDDDCVYNINMTATRISEIPCKEPLFCLFLEPPICYCNECPDLSSYLAKGSHREQELNISYSDKVVNGTHLGGTNATITCAKYGPHAMLTVFDRAGRAIVASPSVVAMCDSRNHWVLILAGSGNPFASEHVHDGETREFDDGGGDDSPDEDDFTPDHSDFDSPSAADDAMASGGKHKKKHHKGHHKKHHMKHHKASRGKYFKKIHPKDEDDKLYARAYKGCYDFYPDCKHKLTKHDCTKPRPDIGLFVVDEAIEGCAVYCRKCKEHNEEFDGHHKVRKGAQFIEESEQDEEGDEEDSEEHEGDSGDEDDSEDLGEEHHHQDDEEEEEDSELEEEEEEETGEEDDES